MEAEKIAEEIYCIPKDTNGMMRKLVEDAYKPGRIKAGDRVMVLRLDPVKATRELAEWMLKPHVVAGTMRAPTTEDPENQSIDLEEDGTPWCKYIICTKDVELCK